jgi:transposase
LGTKIAKKKLQLSCKKPRLGPGQCPKQTIQYENLYRIKVLLLLSEAGIFHLVFGDPTHKVHNTIPGKCWQEKGAKNTMVLSSNSGRKRVTILGFMNPTELKFSSLVTESNADRYSNEIAHKELRKDYPDGKEIIVIQDNARYNHSFASGTSIKALNITPFFLPPYCPNLNLIERLWKFMKKKIMKNTYYPTFLDFWQAILNFCGNLNIFYQEIKSIFSQKFQIIKEA